MRILTINSGSSSIKYALFTGSRETPSLAGAVSGIGLARAAMKARDGEGRILADRQLVLPDHRAALDFVIGWLRTNTDGTTEAVGHRLVHGGSRYTEPRLVTPQLLAALEELVPFAPDHLPHELDAIRLFEKAWPAAGQVACFDTAFHRTMPGIAQLYALPAAIRGHGVLRYGFHGLSYEYVLNELGRIDPAAADGRLIIAHLGNGASMAAVRNGASVDTTMGFTPAGGLVMSTRTGDLDPGVIVYLIKEKGMNAAGLNRLINKEAGLLAVSGTSFDMRNLLEAEKRDPRASEAVSLFCFEAKKFLGSLAAVLGGVDTLVFTGGIGEHAAPVRWRICEHMDFLGIRLDPGRNDAGAEIISADGSAVTVRVMKTNEELMIARHTRNVMSKTGTRSRVPHEM